MALLTQLIDFLKILFVPGNPDIQKNQLLKAIEIRLSKSETGIYKNGVVQISFANALYTIYSNIGVFNTLLDFIHSPEQKLVKNRVYDILIKTGYNESTRKKVDMLTYEMRRLALDSSVDRNAEINSQMQIFTTVQKDLNTTGFAQIEKTIQDLELFYDLSSYNFINILKLFDPAFSPLDGNPNFKPVPCEDLCEELLNFYFVSAKLNITGSMSRAIDAVSSIIPGRVSVSQDDILARLKKIATALNKVLNPDILKDLIALGKKDSEIAPEASASTATPLQDYVARQKAMFSSDTERLRMEYQDQERLREIKAIFGEKPLLPLNGYNPQINAILQDNTAFSFLWITPMQVLKSFITYYFTEDIQTLLNDIVVEGFFNSPEAKTDFSSAFFECSEVVNVIQSFEDSFTRNERYDSTLLTSYVKDSQKDPEFVRTLGNMVSEINNTAKVITQAQSTNLFELYNLLLLTLEDSRLSTPELISNVKFLFTSSRNRDRVEVLEKSMPKWASFLNLMKHYAQLGNIEVPREEKRQHEKNQKE